MQGPSAVDCSLLTVTWNMEYIGHTQNILSYTIRQALLFTLGHGFIWGGVGHSPEEVIFPLCRPANPPSVH